METFRRFIEQHVAITDDNWADIQRRVQYRTLKKNQFYLRPGQVNGGFAFVEKGALRVFYTAPDGNDYTAWLAVTNQMFCDLASFRAQQPTRFSVQALTTTTLLTLSYADVQSLYATLPVWQEFGRKFWEDINVRLIDAIVSFQTESAEVRYERISRERDLLQSAPLKYVAEFLGITPHTLSRIRRKR